MREIRIVWCLYLRIFLVCSLLGLSLPPPLFGFATSLVPTFGRLGDNEIVSFVILFKKKKKHCTLRTRPKLLGSGDN